ncbi:MAG: beta-ketoacyl-ACP synthase II [Deltaproteobacteria bacterium]|nr:beta-ketoacyl-ACP synthase II [Deltaproteobacteria bacterium]
MNNHRVVITGLGVISPNAIGKEEFETNLRNGVSGAAKVTSFDASRNKSRIACAVEDFKPLDFIDAKTIRRTSRFIHLAIAASSLAIADSKLVIPEENEIGVFIGTGGGGYDSLDETYLKFLKKGPAGLSPFTITNLIPNMAASNVAIKWGLNGPCSAPAAACASGSYAINDAYYAIRTGIVDTALAGGTDSGLTSFVFSGYEALRVLSTNNDAPVSASRPFDLHRDGFVMGEGAAVLVLESYKSALDRGARILAEVVSSVTSCDASHLTSPNPAGTIISKTMKMALDKAGIESDEIAFINAHGTSTKVNDLIEAMGIHRVFGSSTPVTSIKSMIGHTFGAAGALACAASIISLNSGFISPTINFHEKETDMPPIDVVSECREIEDGKKYSLINAFGFGGHNACLIVKSL